MRSLCVLVVMFVAGCHACGNEHPEHHVDRGLDGPTVDVIDSCNVLTQAGCAAFEKCTWLVDAEMPTYVAHIGCAPDGTVAAGEACTFGAPGATGYDNCARGLVCSAYKTWTATGTCRPICDQQGGNPACDVEHVCVVQPDLFSTGATMQPQAGLCEPACDPLADNDFDGSGSDSTKTGTTCGSDPSIGCYGYPSFGTEPATAWACMPDLNAAEAQPTGLRHRVACTSANHCILGTQIFVNSCNQGYVPLLRESTSTSRVICVALCKPINCYAGNCGTNDEDRLGEAPHRCTSPDRVGTFDTSPGGEHCRFFWSLERDDQGTFLRSSSSDTLGFCFDHGKYLYDSDGDGNDDTPYPPCASLPDGFGSGGVLGAADVGCVDTTHAQLADGASAGRVMGELRPLASGSRPAAIER